MTLHEAHRTLGGRGRAIAGPYLVHEGAHVFYADGPHWAWLRERGLVDGLGRPAVRDYRMGFVRDGRMRLLPPAGFLRMMATGPRTAPVEMDFHTWASRSYGERTARVAANAISVVTYDADTGRLSAAFVWDLLRRVFAPRPPHGPVGGRRLAGGDRPARRPRPRPRRTRRAGLSRDRAAGRADDRRDRAVVGAAPARRRHAALGERRLRDAGPGRALGAGRPLHLLGPGRRRLPRELLHAGPHGRAPRGRRCSRSTCRSAAASPGPRRPGGWRRWPIWRCPAGASA
ncbi:hypothetical protein ACFSTC_02230 [Nonomuraea ferruginea]